MKDEFIRVGKVAEMLGVSPATIRRWIAEGYGPKGFKTPFGEFRFRRSDIEAWIMEACEKV